MGGGAGVGSERVVQNERRPSEPTLGFSQSSSSSLRERKIASQVLLAVLE